MQSQLRPDYKTIFAIGIPLFLGNMAWTFVAITDQAFMGQVGRVEEAAIGPVSIFYSLIMLIGMGFSRGTQLWIANRLGANEPKKIGNILDNALLLGLLVAIVVFLVIYFGSAAVLQFAMHDAEIIVHSTAFVKMRIWGVFAGFTGAVLMAFYSGIAQTGILTISVGAMSILNIVLNYIFVFGKFGFQPMGIVGSALASVISEYFSMLILFFGLYFKQRKKMFDLLSFTKISVSKKWQLFLVSLPLILQSLLANGAWLVFYTQIEQMGRDNLAIANYMRSIIMFIGISAWTLGSVANTIVSNLVGQVKQHEIYLALKKLSLVSVICVLLQSVLLLVFKKQILLLFTKDMSQVTAAYPSLYMVVGAMLLMSFSAIYFNGVVSLGNTRYALYIELAGTFFYLVLFYFLLKIPDVAVSSLWATEYIYWIVLFVMSIFFFRKNKVKWW